ncbi:MULTISPECIES: ABC transporter permease [Thermoanaerobacter]|uniref:ABC-type transport system involved in multi-copper enzyme maturation permease subunit n=1 Tax=Thermoanaerobacter pentosaceus TaxID=694059 RepID=A0ABT9M193_9THEO|nr:MULTISPECIES: ABC transporter permease [Thermoanaerobacter]MDP9749888.1 ABC-type transport system involved in multi-copper enzyme maturation permease subunit [Thermoanaerobacter pentosaceus]
MRRFYYIELYKLFKRKDVFWSLLISIFVPLLFGLLAKTESDILTISGEKFSAFQYAIMMFGFLKSLFLFYFMFIIFTSSTFAGELEKGNLSLLLVRSENRVKIMLSKVLALLTVLMVFIIFVVLSGIISYYIFLYNTKFATNEFLGRQYLTFLYMPLLSIFEIILIIAVTMLLSLFFGIYKTNLLSIGLIILMKVLEKVDKIKGFIPTYLADINAWGNIYKTEYQLLIKVMQNIGFLGIYIVIVLIVTLYYFSRMEIKN